MNSTLHVRVEPKGMRCLPGAEEAEEMGVISGIDKDWLEIHRVIAKDSAGRYLVKWKGLPYSEATWESSLMPSDKVQHQHLYHNTVPLTHLCQHANAFKAPMPSNLPCGGYAALAPVAAAE